MYNDGVYIIYTRYRNQLETVYTRQKTCQHHIARLIIMCI